MGILCLLFIGATFCYRDGATAGVAEDPNSRRLLQQGRQGAEPVPSTNPQERINSSQAPLMLKEIA